MTDWNAENSYPFSGAPVMPYEDGFSSALDTARLFIWAAENLRDYPGYREDIGAALRDGLDFLSEREELSSEKISFGITEVRHRFNLTGFEFICFCLAAAYNLLAFLGQNQETPNEPPTFGLAASLYAASFGDGIFPCVPERFPLGYLLDIKKNQDGYECFALKKYVFDYITGNSAEYGAYIRVVYNPPEFELYPEAFKKLCRCLETKAPESERICIVLSGIRGGGRRTLAAQVCRAAGKGALIVTPPHKPEQQEFESLLEKAAALSVLTDSYIIADAYEPSVYRYWSGLSRHTDIIFFCAGQDERPDIDGFRVLRIDLPEPEMSVRTELWRNLGWGLNFDPEETSERYHLTAERIAAVTTAVRLFKDTDNDVGVLRQEISRQNTGCALTRLIRPAFILDDLIINERTKHLLGRICETFRIQPRLYERGYGKLFPYGRGLGVLFHGASGLGKTMAAQALAKELGLDVMAADLSRMADKYIGETEKHITEVFNNARENNCVLFFDEADAMFAKRAKVSDAQDRHANSHTAHLLQKMEDYSGLVILSSNLMENIDDAFKRRLPFIVEFTRPDAVLRERLWRNFLRDTDEGIDIQFLSRTFDITPAVIKWAAFSAAVSAESEGKAITMEHILDALRYEYEKTGAVFPEKDIDITL